MNFLKLLVVQSASNTGSGFKSMIYIIPFNKLHALNHGSNRRSPFVASHLGSYFSIVGFRCGTYIYTQYAHRQ